MYRILYIVLIISCLPMVLRAQEHEQNEKESPLFNQIFKPARGEDRIHLIQEPKLDEILLAFVDQNRKMKGIPCYWIRIYSGSSNNAREEAYETKARFLRKYEGIRNDVIYDDPNFKVYIGGYRSKSETLKLLNTLKRDFPTAFIVYDVIDFPEK